MFDDKERIVESVDDKAETKRSDDTDAKIDAETDSERMMATDDTTQLRVIEDDAREEVGGANTDSLLDNTFGDKVRIPLPLSTEYRDVRLEDVGGLPWTIVYVMCDYDKIVLLHKTLHLQYILRKSQQIAQLLYLEILLFDTSSKLLSVDLNVRFSDLKLIYINNKQ